MLCSTRLEKIGVNEIQRGIQLLLIKAVLVASNKLPLPTTYSRWLTSFSPFLAAFTHYREGKRVNHVVVHAEEARPLFGVVPMIVFVSSKYITECTSTTWKRHDQSRSQRQSRGLCICANPSLARAASHWRESLTVQSYSHKRSSPRSARRRIFPLGRRRHLLSLAKIFFVFHIRRNDTACVVAITTPWLAFFWLFNVYGLTNIDSSNTKRN